MNSSVLQVSFFCRSAVDLSGVNRLLKPSKRKKMDGRSAQAKSERRGWTQHRGTCTTLNPMSPQYCGPGELVRHICQWSKTQEHCQPWCQTMHARTAVESQLTELSETTFAVDKNNFPVLSGDDNTQRDVRMCENARTRPLCSPSSCQRFFSVMGGVRRSTEDQRSSGGRNGDAARGIDRK